MAPRKQVPSLFNRSGETFASVLNTVCDKFLSEAISVDVFNKSIQMLEQSRNILVHSQPKIAELWLNAADKLVRQRGSSSRDLTDCSSSFTPKIEFVVQSLVSVATQCSLKLIKLSNYSEPVRSSLLTHSERLTNLEYLNCSLSQGAEYLYQQVFDSLPFLKNLSEFRYSKCTDEMIMALCEHCQLLTHVILDRSPQVTDKSLEYLARLKKLQLLDLIGTKVTEKQLVRFLMMSKSNVFEIFIGLDVNVFLTHLEMEVVPFRTFSLKYLWCTDADSNLLALIPKYFPRMRSLFLRYCLESVPNLVFLNSLEYLEVAKLHAHDEVVSPDLGKFLSLQSPMLTELILSFDSHVELAVQIDFHSFLELGLHCPNLESVYLECSFSNEFGTTHLTRNPFQKLKCFQLSCCYSATGIGTILGFGINIEKIAVLTEVGLSDNFLASVFKVNPLSKLKNLELSGCESHISVEMMKFVIKNCPEITFIRFSPNLTEAIEEAQKFIIQNNFSVTLL